MKKIKNSTENPNPRNERLTKRRSSRKEGKVTSIFHDMEKGRDDSGDGLELHGSFPSPFCIHHTPQRIIQYPPPHLLLLEPKKQQNQKSKTSDLSFTRGIAMRRTAGG